ncbi:O-antigen ligase family protein [Flavobacteriaceae bacterium]|nr:O-antigen ligase family protein [Flavobacteriaceae bacterium]
MNIINNISFYNQLLLFLIYLNSATILIPDKFKGWPIALLLLVVLIRYFKLDVKPVLETKKFLISIGFFLILVSSVAYSSDISFALKKVETGLSLVVFPLIFYIIGDDKDLFTKKTIEILKLTFIISLLFFLVSMFTYFYLTDPFFSFKNTLEHYTNLVDIRVSRYSTHSIYLSIYIGIAVLFTLSIIKSSKRSIAKIFLFFALLIFIVFIAILNKKGPIISLGVVGLFFLISNKLSSRNVLLMSITMIVLVSLIVFLPRYKNENKFYELLEIGKDKNSSSGLRLQIYECSIQQIVRSPIFGYGWGDVKTVLNDCYTENKSLVLLENNYNSHNQYLSVLLSTGILGFVAFMYYFFYILKISNKRDSQLLFLLTLYFCLNMLTENVLEREDGVIIIALLINIFLFSINVSGPLSSNMSSKPINLNKY